MALSPNSIITPQTPFSQFTDAGSKTACTTRAPTNTAGLAAANIFVICSTSTNGRQINKIQIKGSASGFTGATQSETISIWQHDGSTAYIIDEIQVSAVTPSTTTPSFKLDTYYSGLVLPATHSLYASVSIATSAATTALTIGVYGGDL